jgi:3-methyladenine DNA glycosylase AlkC
VSEEPFSLKESLFNRQTVLALAEAVHSAYPALNLEAFIGRVLDEGWGHRALKERMRHVTMVLHDYLQADYRAALAILQAAAPAVPYGSFVAMVPADYVSLYGLDDYEASVAALEVFTQRVSAEFAVRPFIMHYPQQMMAQMLAWAGHANEDVRRLASEGCRPRLPWGMALPTLKKDPSPILPILEKLKNDPSETVRRSVANNLNDIAKDNPSVVLDTLARWGAADQSAEMRQLTKHALRTLIKAGDGRALELVGVAGEAAVRVFDQRVEPDVIPSDGEITFSLAVESLAEQPQELMIDYVVHFVRLNGKQTPKVFKLVRRTIQPGEVIRLVKKHSFRPITTRRYYPGEHAIQVQINGQPFPPVPFTLLPTIQMSG